MRAEELRRGNYVSLEDNRIVQIDEIHKESVVVYDSEQDTIESIERIKPITLKKEWLLCFWFKKQNNGWNINDFGLFDHNFCEGELKLKLNACECPLPYVNYVHQLQNLYYALTGQELVFNPKQQ